MSENVSRVEKLKGRQNYDEWRVSAKSYLTIRGLWPAITGEATPEVSPQTNAKAISEITLMVEASLYSYIIESKSAKEVWDALTKAFDDSGIPRKVTILNQLVSIRLLKFRNMESYINEILLFWQKSKIAGFKIDEDIIASLMLGGLPESYRALILGIENSAKELTVDYVKNVLLQGIRDPLESQDDGQGAAMAASCSLKMSGGKKKKCFTCGSVYHLSFSCPKKRKRKCFTCGSTSHLAPNCPKKRQVKIRGRQQNSPKRKKRTKRNQKIEFW